MDFVAPSPAPLAIDALLATGPNPAAEQQRLTAIHTLLQCCSTHCPTQHRDSNSAHCILNGYTAAISPATSACWSAPWGQSLQASPSQPALTSVEKQREIAAIKAEAAWRQATGGSQMVFQWTVSVVRKQLNAGCSGNFCCPSAADAALEIQRKLELRAFASPSSAPPALPAAGLV